jgi:photosystem II stability/assembly factor-like uncharacterized protein
MQKFTQCLVLDICIIVVGLTNSVHAQWIPTNGPLEGLAFSLAVGTTGAGDTSVFAGTFLGSVFRTSDNGNSWTEIDGGTWWAIPQDTGFTSNDILGLFACPNGAGGTSLFAATVGAKIYRSINSDTNWTDISSSPSYRPITSLIVTDTNILAGTDSGVSVSTDFGANWKLVRNELTLYCVYSLTSITGGTNATDLFASTSGGIFLSTNGGVNWKTVNTAAQSFLDLVACHNAKGSIVVYAFSGDGVFCSVDSGVNWAATTKVSPYSDATVICLALHDTVLFAGTFQYGIYYSTNGGKKWVDGNSGMGRRSVFDLAIVGANLFAAVSSDIASIRSVWRRPLSEMPTGVGDKYEQNPTEFKLEQNYPNPFNPTTVIPFSLQSKSFVSLKIYDLIGRVIATIISEELSAGNYLKQWNADGLPSGVYFCQLRAGSLVEMKKLMLMR